MGFKTGIKRKIAAYASLKDERYFDGFKRSLLIVAQTHECNEVLDPNYTPCSEPEEKELFEAKQTFMFNVFNANLQTDMGTTIVRRHLSNTDAQAVWNEHSEHMRTSSNIRILSEDQILVSCSHMTCYLQNLHYISIYIFH